MPGQVEVNLPPDMAPDMLELENAVKDMVLKMQDLKLPPVTMDGMVTLIPPAQHMNMVLNAFAQLCAQRITNGITLAMKEIKERADQLVPVDTPPD